MHRAQQLPITGSNSEANHRGSTFHVQTEDSGAAHPHVITHLFADGGRIIATRKTSYLEWRDEPDRAELVRFLIRLQHKTMLSSLKGGSYDPLLLLGSANEPKVEPALDLASVRDLRQRAQERASSRDVPPAPAAAEVASAKSHASAPRPLPVAAPPNGGTAGEGWAHAHAEMGWMAAENIDDIILEELASALARPRT